MKKKTGDVKRVMEKQPISTTKVGEEKTFVRSSLSWLYAAPVTKESMTTRRGQKSKAT